MSHNATIVCPFHSCGIMPAPAAARRWVPATEPSFQGPPGSKRPLLEVVSMRGHKCAHRVLLTMVVPGDSTSSVLIRLRPDWDPFRKFMSDAENLNAVPHRKRYMRGHCWCLGEAGGKTRNLSVSGTGLWAGCCLPVFAAGTQSHSKQIPTPADTRAWNAGGNVPVGACGAVLHSLS